MPQDGVSHQTTEALKRELPALLEAVQERLSVDASFHCGEMSCDRLALSREYNEQFGRVLLAVCDFGLFDHLRQEFNWLAGVLSRRGFAAGYLGRMLEAWSMVAVTHLGAGEATELTGLLDGLRRNLGLFFEAQRREVALTRESQQFLGLLQARQRRNAADHALAILKQGAPLPEVVGSVVLPALARVGALWESAALSAAEEHAATELCRYVLWRLFDEAVPEPSIGCRALVSCVPGEEHALGALLVSEHLRLKGWDVLPVGRSAPQEDILVGAAKFKPDVLFLSVTMVANLPAARELVAAARFVNPKLGVVIGGRAALLARERLESLGVAVVKRFDEAHEAGRSA
jgi:methanogenic corrinoid protein MtbC1